MSKIPEHKLLDNVLVSETMIKIGQKDQKGTTKISALMEEFHENGLLLAMVFFSLPVAIPLPYPPGFTTIIGAPLIILAVQMILGGRKVKLPQKVNDYEMKNTTLKMISDKVVPLIEKMEKFIRPRMDFAKSVYCEQFVGLICLISAIAVLIPLPFTNAVPAQSITIMSLGLLNRDGLIIIGGFIVAIIGNAIALGAVIGSWVAIKYLFNTIF